MEVANEGRAAAATAGGAPRFVITGFSTFSGVEVNPTEHLVRWMQRHVEQGLLPLSSLADSEEPSPAPDGAAATGSAPASPPCPSAPPAALLPHAIHVHHLTVLTVAAEDVEVWHSSVVRPLAEVAAAPDADDVAPERHPCPPGTTTLCVHFGVDSKATTFRLEQCAYNEATFRVPDRAGWQPAQHLIEPALGLAHCLRTRLDVGALRERLAERGHPVEVSQDAGRYLCNWVYFRSLQAAAGHGGGPGPEAAAGGGLESGGQAPGGAPPGSGSGRLQALFVHVPPFGVIEEAQLQRFAVDLLRSLAQMHA